MNIGKEMFCFHNPQTYAKFGAVSMSISSVFKRFLSLSNLFEEIRSPVKKQHRVVRVEWGDSEDVSQPSPVLRSH